MSQTGWNRQLYKYQDDNIAICFCFSTLLEYGKIIKLCKYVNC
jgi:hypothetical protein